MLQAVVSTADAPCCCCQLRVHVGSLPPISFTPPKALSGKKQLMPLTPCQAGSAQGAAVWPCCPQPLKIPLEEQQFCSRDELSRKARGSGDIPAFSCQWFQGMLPVSPCLRHFMGNGARKDKKKQPRDHVFLILFWLFLSPLRSRSEVPLYDTALSAVPLPWHCIFQTKPNQTKPVMHQKAKPVFLI